jgi:transposase
MTLYTNFVGVDIGKFEFVVNVHGSKNTKSYTNDSDGIAQFYQELSSKLTSALVVLENTGGYENMLVSFLYDKKIALHRANGRQVKFFIRSHAIIAKTDQVDAMALSCYAFERHDKLNLYQPNAYDLLQELVVRRDDLIAIRTQEKNRLASAGKSSRYYESCKIILEALNQQVKLIDEEIKDIIANDKDLDMKNSMLQTVPGIGQVTAASILAHMPEIGTMNQKQVASLAGVAPHPNQSGTKNGYRRTRGGRRKMRPILFIAAFTAIRSKSALGEFYQRLIANGKAKMCAIVAVMRKMVVIANARIKQQLALTTTI